MRLLVKRFDVDGRKYKEKVKRSPKYITKTCLIAKFAVLHGNLIVISILKYSAAQLESRDS